MSKPADAVTIRYAQPDEREVLEALQWRASFALREYRDQLDGTSRRHRTLPPSRLPNGQVIVAELDGQIAGFAAVWSAGELDGLFVEPDLWRRRDRRGAGRRRGPRGARSRPGPHGRSPRRARGLLRKLRIFSRGRGADALRAGAQDVALVLSNFHTSSAGACLR